MPFITNGTVLSNITYPKKPSSADNARINEITQTLGFDYNFLNREITDRGKTLSGGEKQRIGLMRALFANRNLLILDEITANIDHSLEISIFNYLVLESKKRAILLITHANSDSLNKSADQILYFEKV
jgi:ABC-type transport system involved in cytochrome bd biosynthesis fused ATPase/permease subunit